MVSLGARFRPAISNRVSADCQVCELHRAPLRLGSEKKAQQTMIRRLILSAGLALGLCAHPATAQDATGFASAMVAVEAEDWDTAYALATPVSAVAADLITWHRLRAGAGIFTDYTRFLDSHAHWPGLPLIRAKAEEAMDPDIAPAPIIGFFAEAPPQTGAGVIRLAQAYIASGDAATADTLLRDAWLTLGLTDESQELLLTAFGTTLAPHHAARTDAMLWRWRTTDAARMLPLLDADQRALAEARIALIDNTSDRAAKIAAVPDALSDNPGLAYDRFNRLATDGDYSDAVTLLAERSSSPALLGEPFRWASWRATLARWAMREGRPQQAYDLAVQHHLTSGELFADLEWLAGFIALTDLNDPALALTHFQRFDADVSGPISASRAGYWLGRTHEVLGDTDSAAAAFGRAAQNQTAFYGLLAAERLGLPLDPALTGREVFPDWQQGGFLRSDLTQAMLLLLGADERGGAVQFVAQLGKTLDRTELAQFGAMLAAMDEPFLTVLLGKTAVERGIILPAIYFPMHDLAQMTLPVAPELALAIARRESEFNAVVGSPVGALGLMQLMPATAEEVAGELGLPYSRARLTADWEYNATLGSRYLANLEETFGPSPVMIAAGYNAGPSRPRAWIGLRGDPRRGEVDVVDWIEHIPFTETRNYVMRVTESIPVYQARLSGETGSLQFTALLIGAPPLIRPQARPDDTSPDTGVVALDIATSGPVTTAPAVAPLRPQARPEG